MRGAGRGWGAFLWEIPGGGGLPVGGGGRAMGPGGCLWGIGARGPKYFFSVPKCPPRFISAKIGQECPLSVRSLECQTSPFIT